MKDFMQTTTKILIKEVLKWISIVIILAMFCGLIMYSIKTYNNYKFEEVQEEQYIDSLKYDISKLQLEKDSLKNNVKVRTVIIERIKHNSDSTNAIADSSYNEFKNNPDLEKCSDSLDKMKRGRDSLDSECNYLTQQNSDLTEITERDSAIIIDYQLSLNSCQKNNIVYQKDNFQLKKDVKREKGWKIFFEILTAVITTYAIIK